MGKVSIFNLDAHTVLQPLQTLRLLRSALDAPTLAKRSVSRMTMDENNKKADDLKPKPPPKLAPRGIRSFTVCRQNDETGVSGEGVVIEGVVLASGHCIIHWLFPPPRGGIAIFDSLEDFLKVHVKPHPDNKTLITFEDGEQKEY